MDDAPHVTLAMTAIIVAVTDEVPRILTVRRMTHALATPAQREGHPTNLDGPDALPSGPFDPTRHRTLDAGLRSWVEEQTGLPLHYVEQLYTFGDRYRDPRELSGGSRVVSIGYIALTRQALPSGSGEAEWRDFYGFFPWEDWRQGQPAILTRQIRPRLKRWIDSSASSAIRTLRRERAAIAFGLGAAWDFDRTLERYELLYEADLIVEALRDRAAASHGAGQSAPPAVPDEELSVARQMGAPMALDHRRILATALGRLRGTLKYRPLVFDLLPPSFTLFRLQRTVEALAGVRLHKQNFRRLVIKGGFVEPTGKLETQDRGRPAALFAFRREVLRERLAPGLGLPAIRSVD